MLVSKNKKRKFLLILTLSIIFLINIFFLSKSQHLIANIAQELKIFSYQPAFEHSNASKYRKLKDILLGLINFAKYGYNAEILYIDISFKNLNIIKEDRSIALWAGINLFPRKVPVILRWKNKTYYAAARLKGDLPNHWGNNKQWSLKLELKKGESIEGFKEFSITKFAERQFPNNQLIAKGLSTAGIMTPRFVPMRVNLNGTNWGIMLAEEQYSNAYLELRRAKVAPIIKFTNEDITQIQIFLYGSKKFSKTNLDKDIVDLLSKWKGQLEIDIFNQRNYINNPNYEGMISSAKSFNEGFILNTITSEEIEQFINIPMFAKVFASSLVWGDRHSLGRLNIRFYLNPYTGLLEPIPTDHLYNTFSYKNIKELKIFLLNSSNLFFNHKILGLQSFQKEYLKALQKIEQSYQYIKEDLKNLCGSYGTRCVRTIDLNVIRDNLNLLLSAKQELFSELDNYVDSKNNTIISDLNFPDEYPDLASIYKNINFFTNDIYARAFADGELMLFNLTPFEIRIRKIKIDNFINDIDCQNSSCKSIETTQNIVLYPSSLKSMFQKKYKISKDLNLYKKINLYIELLGTEKIVQLPIEKTNFKIKSLIQNNNKLPGFVKLEKTTYTMDSGQWTINEPLIIPKGYNLSLLPNTEISFQRNSYIYLDGGYLESSGTPEKPIILKPLDKFWGGIFISRSKEKTSKISYTKIIGTNFFKHKAINLTGGINFYLSNVEINNSDILNSYAEDSLNIVHSDFVVKSSNFFNHQSDAIDSDFSQGIIENVLFKNILGDGLDTSGSKVSISSSGFENISDKAISVGEKSFVSMKNIEVNKSGFGFVSKDGSVVIGHNINIFNSTKADIAAYKKKSFYSGGKININNTPIENRMIFIQKGSSAIINNKKVPTISFDTAKKFY
jgi:hypothetical protein